MKPGAHQTGDPAGDRYAIVIERGTRIASVVMAVGFLVYLAGIGGDSLIPPQELPRYWSMSAHDLNLAVGGTSGWSLFRSPGHSERFAMLGVMMLAGLSALASASVMPLFWRRRDRMHSIALIFHVVIVLVSAANLGHGLAALQHQTAGRMTPALPHLRPQP